MLSSDSGIICFVGLSVYGAKTTARLVSRQRVVFQPDLETALMYPAVGTGKDTCATPITDFTSYVPITDFTSYAPITAPLFHMRLPQTTSPPLYRAPPKGLPSCPTSSRPCNCKRCIRPPPPGD